MIELVLVAALSGALGYLLGKRHVPSATWGAPSTTSFAGDNTPDVTVIVNTEAPAGPQPQPSPDPLPPADDDSGCARYQRYKAGL